MRTAKVFSPNRFANAHARTTRPVAIPPHRPDRTYRDEAAGALRFERRNETLQAERMSVEAKLRGESKLLVRGGNDAVCVSMISYARKDDEDDANPDGPDPERALHPLLRRHLGPRVDDLSLCLVRVRVLVHNRTGRLGCREWSFVCLVRRRDVCVLTPEQGDQQKISLELFLPTPTHSRERRGIRSRRAGARSRAGCYGVVSRQRVDLLA